MSDIKRKVDINSPEFEAGVDAGLKSTEDTKNWQAGLELGQALKADSENTTAPLDSRFKESSLPLFLRTTADGTEDNLQDEKDGSAE